MTSCTVQLSALCIGTGHRDTCTCASARTRRGVTTPGDRASIGDRGPDGHEATCRCVAVHARSGLRVSIQTNDRNLPG